MNTELAVIGGGPAGYTAAIRGAQRGINVTLVESKDIGGTCLNDGCIPSKALLSATKTVRDMETSEEKGIYVEPYVDVEEMMDWKEGIVTQLTDGVAQLCQQNGVRLLNGFARFEDSHTLSIDESEELSFENALIATGSRAMSLPGFSFDEEPIIDAKQALSIDQIPSRILVIGAGYIGMELSTVFARLGSDVTVVELLDSSLPQFDSDLIDPVYDTASDLGITLNFGETATDWHQGDNGRDVVVSTETDNGETSEYRADHVLVAVGREPVTEGLNLDPLSATTNEQGFIEADQYGRTASEHIFAAGDVAGEPLLAHAGSHEGIIVAETLADENPPSNQTVPAVVFTEPEVATVGYSLNEATAEGIDATVGEFPFSASGRAMTVGEDSGFVRLVVDDSGRIIGGQIVGPDASELIAEIGIAVEGELSVTQLAQTIHAHPTLSEATMEAAEHVIGQAIHTLN